MFTIFQYTKLSCQPIYQQRTIRKWNKENNPIYYCIKRIKYLRINYLRRQKTTTFKFIRHWWKKSKIPQTESIPCSWIRRINVVKMTIVSKAIYIQRDLYQITSGIFHRTRTKNFTICMEIQKTLNRPSILEKEEWR